MTKDDFLKITGYIGSIIEGTEWEGHVYAVGGSVRDYVMGNDIKDIDLVIDLPDGGVRFAEWCAETGYSGKVVKYPTYGTAMFRLRVFPDEEIECVMTRGEKYNDCGSRNPDVEYCDIKDDAIRRDLTINALYYNCVTGEILDMVGGQKDIRNQIIRTTNPDSDSIFIDDPLRIMRVVRFSSRYGWNIDNETYEAMKRNSGRLSIISKERIRTELDKILLCQNAVQGINTLHDIGAMKYVIPEFDQCYGLTQNAFHFGDVAEHTLAVLEHHCDVFQPNLVERLACLLHDIGKTVTRTEKDGKIHFYEHEFEGAKMCDRILRDLKYDNDTIKEVQFLIKNHMRTKQAGTGARLIKDKTLNKLLYECGTFERFCSLMRIIECDNLSHKTEHCIPAQYAELVYKVEHEGNYMKMFGYKLPVTGNDIMTVLDIKPSPIIAEINKRLLKYAFNYPDVTREECIKMLPGIKKDAEKYLNSHRP